jgi:hypothetical protein
MSEQRASTTEASAPADSLPHATEPRSAISSLVQKSLVTFNERERHRRVLINLLILAQALLVVAAAPGYIGARPGAAALVVVLACLLVCLLAAGLNQLGRDTTRATYVLVVGSAAGVLAQVYLAALTATPAQAAQASLLLLTVLLEAGLFFAPVMAVLLTGGCIALTIVAFVIAVLISPSGSGRETYGLIVGTLGLQTVTGLVAWLLAQFIYESVLESQRSQDAQFAEARLDTLLRQQAERQRQTQEVAASIHQATARALAGDSRARASTVEGDLGALTRDVNSLLHRLAVAGDGPLDSDARAAMAPSGWSGRADETAMAPPGVAFPLSEPRGGTVAGPASGEYMLARRLQRVQEMASELAGALAHSQEGLNAAAAATDEARRVAGASVALAHEVLASVQQAAEVLSRAHRALAPADPGAADDPEGSEESMSFLGLGTDVGVVAPGLTGQFHLSPSGELVEFGATGASDMPVGMAQAATPVDADMAAGGSAVPVGPALHAALDALREAIATQERGATTLTQDLGLISRHVRGIDGHVAWARQAIDAVRRNAERLQATAIGAGPLPAVSDVETTMPPNADAPSRGPISSRPLTDGPRSYPSMPPSTFEPPASADGEDPAPDGAPLE